MQADLVSITFNSIYWGGIPSPFYIKETKDMFDNIKTKVLEEKLRKKDAEIEKLNKQMTELISENEKLKDQIASDAEYISNGADAIGELREKIIEVEGLRLKCVGALEEIRALNSDYKGKFEEFIKKISETEEG